MFNAIKSYYDPNRVHRRPQARAPGTAGYIGAKARGPNK